MQFSVVSGKTVHRWIHGDVGRCVDIIKGAYLAHHRGETVNPNSHFLRFPHKPSARIIALPAWIGGERPVSGIKWIASFPDNLKVGLPRASAVILLNDEETGHPFACLEGSVISAARTAASAALAAETIVGERRARTLGIVGTGLIARYVYTFLMKTGWGVDRICLFDRDPAEARRFGAAVCERGAHAEVSVVDDVGSLMRRSDVVLFATTASAPGVDDPGLLAHAPVVLHLSLRDLAPSMILAAQNIVDDVEHVMNAGTSLHLTEQQVGGRGFVTGTIAGLLRGEVKVDRARPVIFSPFGMGILDLALAKWVFEAALAEQDVTPVADFFFDLSR